MNRLSTPPSHLLRLPRQLRSRIWRDAIGPGPFFVGKASIRAGEQTSLVPALARTSQRIRQEALQIFYRENVFEIHYSDAPSVLCGARWLMSLSGYAKELRDVVLVDTLTDGRSLHIRQKPGGDGARVSYRLHSLSPDSELRSTRTPAPGTRVSSGPPRKQLGMPPIPIFEQLRRDLQASVPLFTRVEALTGREWVLVLKAVDRLSGRCVKRLVDWPAVEKHEGCLTEEDTETGLWI